MDKDRIDGAGKEVKGAIKDAAGKLTGDRVLQAEGKADKAVGKVQSEVGKTKDAIRDAARKIWFDRGIASGRPSERAAIFLLDVQSLGQSRTALGNYMITVPFGPCYPTRTDPVSDNQKQTVGRFPGTLHLDSARLVRERAMQTQQVAEETLKFRAELRREMKLLPPTEPV
jgi:uncharacterized protein YjbJ (UPF0337 family)